MGVSKIILICFIFGVAKKCGATVPVDVLDKVAGFVKHEADVVQDTVRNAAHAVHDLFHPHRHQNIPENYPQIAEGSTYPHQSSSGPSYSHYPSGQISTNPSYPSGQGSSLSEYPTGQGSRFPIYPPNNGNFRPSHGGQVPYTPDRIVGQAHPNYNNYPTGQGGYNTDYSTGQDYRNRNYPNYVTGQDSSNYNYPTGQGSSQSGYAKGQSNYGEQGGRSSYPSSPTQGNPSYNSETLNPGKEELTGDNRNFDVDVRNGGTGVTNNNPTTTQGQGPDGRSLLAFKGCPEGERKDRAGKCRPIT